MIGLSHFEHVVDCLTVCGEIMRGIYPLLINCPTLLR